MRYGDNVEITTVHDIYSVLWRWDSLVSVVTSLQVKKQRNCS